MISPSANDRVDLIDQRLCSYRCFSTGSLANLIFEMLDGLLSRVCIQRPFSGSALDFVGGKMQRPTSPFYLEAKKFKTVSDMHNPRLFPVQGYPQLF